MDFSILVTPKYHIFFGISQRTYKSDSSRFFKRKQLVFVLSRTKDWEAIFLASALWSCEYFSFALFSSQYL
jgi:hypothetical protein